MTFTLGPLISYLISCVRHSSGTTRHTNLPSEPEHTHSFEQQISVKIHSNLVLRQSHPPATGAAACPSTESSTVTAQATSLRVKVASALAITDLGLTLPLALVNDNVIVKGKKQKM